MIPSPKLIIIGALAAGGIALAFAGFNFINQWYADEKAEAQALLDAQGMAQNEAARADANESALQMERLVTEKLQRSLDEAAIANEKINREFTEFRREAGEKERVLQEHDLGKLLTAKPGLIIPRANKATEEAYMEIEELLDGS